MQVMYVIVDMQRIYLLHQHRRIHILALHRAHILLRVPRPRRAGPHPLVQANRHRIHGVNLAIERRLEVTMGTQALLDETAPPTARPQRQALEPPDVAVVEEHVAHGDDALVDLVRVAGEDDALGDDAVHAWGQRGSRADQLEAGGGGEVRGCAGALEVQQRHVAPGQRADEGGNGVLAGVQEAVELVHVVGRVACLGEELVLR